MALLDITEYAELAVDAPGKTIAVGREPAVAEQQLAITSPAVQSAAFSDTTKFIRVHADTACRIAYGVDPTATGAHRRIPANGTEYFGVRAGHKISVITTT